MATPLDFSRAISRFKRLPQIDVWQCAIVALPTWVDDVPGRDPYRPLIALCLSTTRPAAHFATVEMQDLDGPTAPASILITLADPASSAKKTGCRPSVVQVRDPRVVPALAVALEGTGTTVELTERLPALETFMTEMAAEARQRG